MVCNYALSCIDWWGLYTICGNKTANIGILALQAATVERYLHLPKNDCQSFNKSLNRTVPAATYKNLMPVDSSLASPAMSFKRKRAEE